MLNLERAIQFWSKLPIKHRDTGEMVPFVLFPNQAKTMQVLQKQWEEQRKLRAIFLKSRRVTVSSLSDAILFTHAWSTRHVENLIVAHVKDTSEGLFRVPRDLANAVNEKAPICKVLSKRIIIQHRNGPSILDIATAGTISSGRGLTLAGLHLSEAAQYPGQGSFTSLLPALSKGENTIGLVESTAFGKKGIGETFYQFWKRSRARKTEYVCIFLCWLNDPAAILPEELAEDAPATDLERELMKDYGANKAQIAWMRNVLESECQGYEKVFAQEYPWSEHVAFIETGDPAFTRQEMKYAEATSREPAARGHLEWEGGKPRFVRDRRGALAIWSEPRPFHRYYIGADAAVGVEHGDFAAYSIWDGSVGEQVGQFADRIPPEILARQLHLAGIWYNKAMLNGELSGNSGRETLRILRDDVHYPNMYYWKGKDDKGPGAGVGKGRATSLWWETTGYSRRKMFDNFRVALRGGMRKEDYRAIVRDPALVSQMEDATLSDWGRWEVELGHDDILVSAMLAVISIAQYPPPKLAGASHLGDLGETEEEQLRKILPGVVDSAHLSLQKHYKKVMAASTRGQRPERLAGI